MANRYLLPIYKRLYGENFSYHDFENRIQMQKAIYLLQDMGVPVGDYGFRWYRHGPYSQNLQDDMYYEDGKEVELLKVSDENEKCIERLYEVIHSEQRETYSLSHWIECLASLHYLRQNVLRPSATEEDVLSELEQRKTHLNMRNINRSAYHLVEGLF